MSGFEPSRPNKLGATPLPGGSWQFAVWAPNHTVDVCFPNNEAPPQQMGRDAFGYHRAVVDGLASGANYMYRLDGSRRLPDPASRRQPSGVHGPSELVDVSAFRWTDSDWKGVALEDSVFYELHVGTFTPKGTFEAILPFLDELCEFGVTTIELMPIAQFPGSRNWGYDGVYPFAVQNSYGLPRELQCLVNTAHARSLAVALDVVYNHLGPEGNYLAEYGPYFTERYRTPWGSALNFDGPASDEVRYFFIQSALYWLENFHLDALRLDAVHSILDASALPFLAELSSEVDALSDRLGRKIYLIAESDLNDARVLRPISEGGYGMNAQWSDDFHHSVHALLTRESSGYYADFGDVCHLATTLKNGWYYAGQYSRYRRRRHGNSPLGMDRRRFVVCVQNHDQIGNRALGERLSQLVSFERLKLAAGVNVLSCFVPLLFMGEEYGETAPFLYFTGHGDPVLGEAVRRGRSEEFAAFGWSGKIPDPQAEATFAQSKLNHSLSEDEPHRTLRNWYQELLRFRKNHRLTGARLVSVTEHQSARAIQLISQSQTSLLTMLFHFNDDAEPLSAELAPGKWRVVFDSSDPLWLGPGPSLPLTFEGHDRLQVNLQPWSLLVIEQLSPSDQ